MVMGHIGASFVSANAITTVVQQLSTVFIPVSYTHLDVYKRQLLDSPGRAKKCCPTLMIPTTAGTGSEATPNAVSYTHLLRRHCRESMGK